MKHLILGTAGHIDHGKTSLVKALTGIDCDRLKEEKARGITIELGFAHLELPGDIRFGIVDVPGHERFVRTMVAGVGGMDIVMLVIAADEGVMPQTREHLDICQLLGVKSGLVAITKSDLVDQEWLELLQEELRDYLAGSFLENAPLIAVSAKTGAGLDLLRSELARIAATCSTKKREGAFRLPVDRVFTVTGFGTVVTGTLLSGTIKVGDEVELLPAALSGRVRGIQTHGGKVDTGEAGERLAVNIQGIEHSDITRGDTLVPRSIFSTSRCVDIRLQLLATAAKGVKHRARLRLHAATSEVGAEVILLDRNSLEPGEEAFVQLRLAEPTLLLPGDPFVLRSYSPQATVGGGRVLDPFPPRRRRRSAEAMALLSAMAGGEDGEMLLQMAAASLFTGIAYGELLARTGFTTRKLEAVLAPLLSSGELVQMTREPRIFLAKGSFTELQAHLCREVQLYQEQNPLKDGINREELKNRLPKRSDARFFQQLIISLEKDGRVTALKETVSLPEGRAKAQEGGGTLLARIAAALQQGGPEPPTLKELAAALALTEKLTLDHLYALARDKRAVKVGSDLFYASEPLQQIRARLTEHLQAKGEVTPTEFREITGLSRKFMIPLLEYFDQEKLTIRVGDKRLLRRK
jgi:selenocysteine-specific elongation factor